MSPGGFEPPSTGPKPVILSVKLWAQMYIKKKKPFYILRKKEIPRFLEIKIKFVFFLKKMNLFRLLQQQL